MEIDEAKKRVAQILDHERFDPTTGYSPYLTGPVQGAFALEPETTALRRARPREIFTNRNLRIRFESTNYQLLLALLGRVPDAVKATVFSSIMGRTNDPDAFMRAEHPLRYPFWNAFVSELPLVVELCVRQGKKQELFQSISKADPSPAMLILLLQLEDMLAFNFNVFSERELGDLQGAVETFALRCTRHPQRNRVGRHHWANEEIVDFGRFWTDLAAVCTSVHQECQTAQYLHLKGFLQEGVNLEVNQDKETVVSFLKALSFDSTLVASLEKAEELYRSDSVFDLKSSIGHLRSFLENLHIDAAKRVHAKAGMIGAAPVKWGEALLFLKQQGLLTQKEEEMVSAFYTLISDKGIHPLIAEREYARLMRNIAIEYGLLFLSNVEKAESKSP